MVDFTWIFFNKMSMIILNINSDIKIGKISDTNQKS